MMITRPKHIQILIYSCIYSTQHAINTHLSSLRLQLTAPRVKDPAETIRNRNGL